ncbi:MAG: 16S rRNA (cytosine(967)-C(5))-methyltransferase RsmB [Thermotogaceae bacterium]|nr:16S rRNA (cytosine(967)-C(5))-methyltransferase RsmB [Thermotogaceae bacterium]
MNVRKMAYRLLRMFERNKRFPTDEVKLALSRMNDKERAFFKKLVWGTLRRQIYVDWVIDQYLKNPEIPPAIRVVLRIGVYQIVFMDSVPDYAAVSETVSLVEERSFRKLVNAVLRRIAEKSFKEPELLHVKYSHPKWIAEYLVEKYGFRNAVKIMENHLKPIPLVLRVNTLKFERDDLLSVMEEEGYDVKPSPHSPQGIVLKYNGDISKLPYYKGGSIVVQGESSQIVSLILNPDPGEKVLDIAAGYGTKTTHLAELMKNKGKIVAVDISFDKINELNENAKRMGINIIETAVMNGKDIPAMFEADFDKVLIDAPCSSLGTARKNPDVLLTFKKEKINELAKLQSELLNAAYQVLKPEGRLLYSTCTFIKEENKSNVKEFLESHRDMKVVDIRDLLEFYKIDYIWDGYGTFLLPDETLTEFYISLLEKVEN